MLNISENKVHCDKDLEGMKAQEYTRMPGVHLKMRRLLLILLGLFIVFLFLPWTQNIQADGKLTTLRPEQRPQTIHATIAGRIEKWYVMEGQAVKKGDTIVHISEVKPEYFDPQLVERVDNQLRAKEGSIDAYGSKVGALETQIGAMEQELVSKIKQVYNKIEQTRLKIISDSMNVVEAELDLKLQQNQYERIKIMYEKELKSLTEYQQYWAKYQEAQTKLTKAKNDFDITKNDWRIYNQELLLVKNEYANKIAKTQSDKFSTISDQYDAQATLNKLRIDRENYSRRQGYYYIIAPQDGYIVKAVMPGIGEIVKESAPVVSILPADYELAVEMYVKPIDLPLVNVGHKVRFVFDGWPAFFFSGWPGVSTGTYAGKVVAIDRNISSNGKFRVLVEPDSGDHPWPTQLQVGGGARGIALLNNVPVWYEIWRILNGFPPDLYAETNTDADKGQGSLIPKTPVKNAK